MVPPVTMSRSDAAIVSLVVLIVLAPISIATLIADCETSDDNGATWDAADSVYDGAASEDVVKLYPANTADGDDVIAIYFDISTPDIDVRGYDDSADAWQTPVAAITTVDYVAPGSHDCALMHSDNLLYCSSFNDIDSATGDIDTFTVTTATVASQTVTIKTDVVSNVAGSWKSSVFINQQNDDVYVAYSKGGTWLSTQDIVFHKSDDKMATWGSEQAYSEDTADDLRGVGAGHTVGDDGGFYQPAFFNDDIADIFVNLNNDVAIAAAVARRRIAPILFNVMEPTHEYD